MSKLIIPFPEGNLLDEHGYPTNEALHYINNWQFICDYGADDTKIGHLCSDYQGLIDYIKRIWYYDDCIYEEDGLVEIHTGGWSGNEDIIHELKKTQFWMLRFLAQRTGGHYYFKMDSDTEWDYVITKVKK